MQCFYQFLVFLGELLKWPTRADCKSAGFRLPWFESTTHHHFLNGVAGIAQLARASAFQAEGRGFEPRFPLQKAIILVWEL